MLGRHGRRIPAVTAAGDADAASRQVAMPAQVGVAESVGRK